jgi:hypothetical protein
MMKKSLCRFARLFPLPLLAAPLFFASCSSDDSMTPIDEVKTPQRPISVEVSETPFGNTTEARQLTRAAITDLTSFSAFTMMTANKDKLPVEKKNGKWEVDGSWPAVDNNTSVNFYAYSNGTYNDNSGTPYISFSMDENASTQHDLLVAKNTVSYNDHQGKVPLTFDHACAAVAFNVQITKTLKTKLGTTLTVNSIVLRNVSNSGNYYFGTSTWGDVSGSAYYTLTSGNITVDTKAQALSSNYLFVIPQSSEANGTTGTYLDVTYTFSGQTETSATIPLSVNWEAGSKYTINIKLGTTLIK